MLRIKGLFIKEIKIHGGFIKFFLIILMFSFLISLISSFSIIVEYNEIMDTKIYKQIFPDDNNTIEEPELDSIETNKSIKEKLNNIDIKWFDSFKLLITIMSSFIVLFSSSSIYSDEYESGNIKIILSSPLSINEIKISKFLYSLLLTIMPVLLSVIIYIITLLILIHTFSYVYLIYTLITILLIIPIYIIYAHFISSIFNENVYPSVIILFSLLITQV